MRNISEIIEHYLKNILQKSPEDVIEIQRNELADQFQCVPSQINYVISTRFTLEKGFLVESKRGGGGYIRIQKVNMPENGGIHDYIVQMIGDQMSQNTSEGIVYQLEEASFISKREAKLLNAALSREAIALKLTIRDEIRAKILKAMLISLLSK